jgi:hypothetical protein
MTPKEKAKELVEKYDSTLTYLESKLKAKHCALIAVDEILKECSNWAGGTNDGWDANRFDYWNEVKNEIEKL